MTNKKIINKAISEMWKEAKKWDNGKIIMQLKPDNRNYLITHQEGKSWPSMGLSFYQSKERILWSISCDDDNTGKMEKSYRNDLFFVIKEATEELSKKYGGSIN